MAFDSSVIAQIPDYAPNPVQAKANTLKLQDLMDTQTLNKMKLSDAKQQEEQQQIYRDVLKRKDISTDKGASEAAEEMTRRGAPDLAMKFTKERQAIKGGELDIQLQKLQIAESQMSALVEAGDTVYRQVEEYKKANPEATPAMLDAKTQEFLTPAIDQLAKNRPDLAPAIDQYKLKPGALTHAGLETLVTSNKQSLAQIQELHAQQKGERDEKRIDIDQQRANTQAVQAATSARREEDYHENVES